MATTKGRATFFFRFKDQGWTETYARNSASLSGLLGLGMSLGIARKQLLGRGASWIGLRVSDDAVLRDSRTFVPDGTNAVSSYYSGGATLDQAENAWEAIKIRMETNDDRYRSIKHLRGFPEGVANPATPSGISTAYHDWTPLYLAWLTALQGGWGFFAKTAAGPPPVYTLQPITSVVLEKMVKKSTGRPFDLPVGRARA